MDYLICKCCGKPKKKMVKKEYVAPDGKGRDNSAHHFVPGADHTERVHLDITAPATPVARTWAGHRYGSQVLRNLIEAILIFRVPWEGRAVDSIVRYGTGTLNIEGSRIASNVEEFGAGGGFKVGSGNKDNQDPSSYNFGGKVMPMKDGGRHPSNFYITHHPDCTRRGTKRVRGSSGKASGPTVNDFGYSGYNNPKGREHVPFYADADGTESVDDFDCVPECVVRKLDEQAGERTVGGPNMSDSKTIGVVYRDSGWAERSRVGYGDTGGPSRFVHTSDYSHEAAHYAATEQRIEDANAVRYQSKPSKVERDAGLRGHFPCVICGEYDSVTHAEGVTEEQKKCRRSIHPTRKPIKLMQYLATLLGAPDTYAPRRLFVPFCGEGSEVSGAILSGEWEEIVGVDSEPTYVARARRAVAYWEDAIRFGQTDPAVILANAPDAANEAGDVQLDLFGDNGKVDAP